jgi:hypothetical protein
LGAQKVTIKTLKRECEKGKLNTRSLELKKKICTEFDTALVVIRFALLRKMKAQNGEEL